MKTPKQIISEITESGEGHKCACVCDRCKNGRETFLLPSDIVAIQTNARSELLAALNEIATYDEQSIWDDDRDDAANAMLEIARQAISAAAMPNDQELSHAARDSR